ncbi:MAG: hypothetical protein OXC00_09990 [Acidimicrobiaceae bacterium]|nr:hypothetical protein [Acidimicrobiaceae bacterium]
MDEPLVHSLMRKQYGLVARAQALDAGMTRHQIQRQLDTKRWRTAAPGVYHNTAVPETPHSRLLAACIAHGGLASHRAAAALHDIDGFRLVRPEIVVAPGRGRSAAGVRLHRSTQMDLARPVPRDGIPCTGLARTMLDLAAVVNRQRLESALDCVLRQERLTYEDLYEVVVSHSRQGRNGLTRLRAVLDDRCGDGPVPLSDWSRWVSDLLVKSGLGRPALEYRVHDAAGDLLAQVDLAYPGRRLAIELDSVRWHHNRESFVGDRRRRNKLQAAGWDVLNFTWEDYASRSAELCAVVARAFAAA